MWVAHGDDLVIAAFEPAVDVPTQRWLVEGGQRVPAGDVARFFAGHLPALAKRFDVLSPDGSVEVPTVGAPRLLLRLTHEPGLRLSLAWSFTYAVGQDRVEVAVGSSTEPTIRDLAAEERLIDGLDALDKAPGLRTARPTVGWSLQPRSGLDGSPMLRFLNLVLPRLEEHPDVDIEVLGTPIPYAEADEGPDGQPGDHRVERLDRLVRPRRAGAGRPTGRADPQFGHGSDARRGARPSCPAARGSGSTDPS
jgi:hypothetical protein